MHPTKPIKGLTVEDIRDLLHYNELTGVLTWRVSSGVRPAGAKAGFTNKGQEIVAIKGANHPYSRIVWMWVSGLIPARLYRIDGNKRNNRFENLSRVKPKKVQPKHKGTVAKPHDHITSSTFIKNLNNSPKWVPEGRGDEDGHSGTAYHEYSISGKAGEIVW